MASSFFELPRPNTLKSPLTPLSLICMASTVSSTLKYFQKVTPSHHYYWFPPLGPPFHLYPSNNSAQKLEWPPYTSLSSRCITLSLNCSAWTTLVSSVSLEWTLHSLLYAFGPSRSPAWNSLPADVPMAHSFTSFSFLFKHYYGNFSGHQF